MEATNNLKENNMETTNEEKDEILDLSLKHTDCFKKLKDFLPSYRPSTPQRKRKKFTEKTCFAISSFEWKLNEEKIRKTKKKLEELNCLKRKKLHKMKQSN